MEAAAPKPACAQCRDTGVKVVPAGEFARASVCPCQSSCPKCGGTGQAYVEKNGYRFLGACSCQLVRQGVVLYNAAQLPALAAGQDFETLRPHFRELESVLLITQETVRTFVPGTTREGLLFSGPVGTGKTHLLAAILRYLTLEMRVPSRYVEISFLYSEIRKGFSEGRSSLQIIAPLSEVPVLAIDELGKGKMSPFEQETVDELISRRYNAGRATFFATNYSLHERSERPAWTSTGQRLEESKAELSLRERVGERVFSRLHQMCRTFEFPGGAPDYRRITARR